MKAQKSALPKPVRGDVFSARLSPSDGDGRAGTCAVVVLSRDSLNANSPAVVVVPVSDAATVKRLFPSQVFLGKDAGGLPMDGVVKAEQIRAILVSQFTGYYGRLDRASLERIEHAVKITLALP